MNWFNSRVKELQTTNDFKQVYDDVEPAVPTSQVDKLMPTDRVTRQRKVNVNYTI